MGIRVAGDVGCARLFYPAEKIRSYRKTIEMQVNNFQLQFLQGQTQKNWRKLQKMP